MPLPHVFHLSLKLWMWVWFGSDFGAYSPGKPFERIRLNCETIANFIVASNFLMLTKVVPESVGVGFHQGNIYSEILLVLMCSIFFSDKSCSMLFVKL